MVLLLRCIAHFATLSLAVALIINREGPAPAPKYAFVSMGFHFENVEGRKAFGLEYELAALATSVRKHSKYPLVLITDVSTFEDPDAFKLAMEKLGVQLYDMEHLSMPQQLIQDDRPFWSGAWSKLQMFNMTSWDRLVWLDTDGMLTRPMDDLFDKSGTWSQGDDFFCRGNPTTVCSGLVSFKPDAMTFKNILAYAETLDSLPGGDQQLIEDYFKQSGQPVQLLPSTQAAFGKCVKTEADMPAFLHKPEGFNDCIRSLVLFEDGQKPEWAEDALTNCTSNMMGVAWRENVCETEFNPDDATLAAFCKKL